MTYGPSVGHLAAVNIIYDSGMTPFQALTFWFACFSGGQLALLSFSPSCVGDLGKGDAASYVITTSYTHVTRISPPAL